MDGGITLCIALALVTLAYLIARIIARCEFQDDIHGDLPNLPEGFGDGEATRESGAGGR